MKTAAETSEQVTGDQPATDPHAPTRQRVARSILEHGPSTAAELAERLGLTAAGVRRHLDGLAEQGLLTSREQRVYGARGRGRPARVFALTDAGRDSFGAGYDDLAVQALEFLARSSGPAAVGAFASARFASLEDHFRRALDEADHDESPTQTLARTLSAEGYAASVRPAVAGEQLCQHHCPVAHVAERFPQLCEAETEAFSRQLGVHVQRLATIAHGDGVCTTHVPRTSPAAGPISHAQTGTSPRTTDLHPGHAPDHEEHT